MRYIKLKNGIIDVYSKFGFNEKYCDEHEDKFEKEFATYAINKHVIKRSNNIEELCDEFIIIDLNDKPVMKNEHERVKELLKVDIWHKKYKTIYGAIWTDKGLIYVAKMNDKGELELL